MSQFGKPHPSAVPASGRSSLLTYEPYYGLREKPFSLSADPRFLYKSPSHAPTFDDLRGGIRRREGLIVLTGDIGTGKTTLCKAVLEELDRKTFSSFVPDPFVSREDLLKMLLIDFGVTSIEDVKSGRLAGASRPELSYSLYDFLKSLVPLQAFAVLVIDEAQNLSVPLLEEIRILSDMEAPEKLLQVVLVGQLELQAKLKLQEMRQVDQRVSVRCELQPMSREVVTGYITHRLEVAGGGRDRIEFSSEAIDEIYRVSKGVPRLVNLICDRALHHGYLERSIRIEPPHVVRATVDLGLRQRPVDPPVITKPEPVVSKPSDEHPITEPAATSVIAPIVVETAPSAKAVPISATVIVPNAAAVPEAVSVTNVVPVTKVVPVSEAAQVPKVVPVSVPKVVRVSETVPVSPVAPVSDSASDHLSRTLHFYSSEPFEADMSFEPSPNPTLRRSASVFAIVIGLAALLFSLSYRQNQSADLAQSMTLPPLPPSPRKIVDHSIDSLQMHIAASTAMSAHAALYSIDVAGFNSVSRSTDLVEQLSAAGYKAYFEDRQFAQGRMYIVRIGPYLLQSDAEADAAKIRRLPGYGDARVSAVLASPKQ